MTSVYLDKNNKFKAFDAVGMFSNLYVYFSSSDIRWNGEINELHGFQVSKVDWRERIESFRKAHGYDYHSAAAYVEENNIQPRISNKGNKVYSFECCHTKYDVLERNLTSQDVSGPWFPKDF